MHAYSTAAIVSLKQQTAPKRWPKPNSNFEGKTDITVIQYANSGAIDIKIDIFM